MCLALLPNGLIVSGSADYEIRIWDILQGCKRVLSGHKEVLNLIVPCIFPCNTDLHDFILVPLKLCLPFCRVCWQ